MQISTDKINNSRLNGGIVPQDIESERAILGSILVDPFAIERVLPIVKPEMFIVQKHSLIYKAMTALHEQSKAIDPILLSGYLKDNNQLLAVDGLPYIIELAELSVSSVNVDGYAERVFNLYARRKLMDIGCIYNDLAKDGTYTHDQLMELAEHELTKLQSYNPNVQTFHNEEVAHIAFTDLSKDLTLLPTGFNAIDQLIIGLESATLTVLAGRPSMGKSAFGLALALQMVALHNRSVAYFSLEMTKEQLEYRLWSTLSVHPHFADYGFQPLDAMRIRQHFIKAPELNADECCNLVNIFNLASTLDIYINEQRGISPETIKVEARRVQQKSIKPLGLVVIDYLQLFDRAGSTASEVANEVARITRYFFKLAKELDCPVLLLSQVGRGCESRNDKRPMMSDLAQSGAIEQIADQIMFCYRDSYYNNNSRNDDIEIIIAKARHGKTGTAKLGFQKNYQAFYNLVNPIHEPD